MVWAPALAHSGTIILVNVLDIYEIVACTPQSIILASDAKNGNPVPYNDI